MKTTVEFLDDVKALLDIARDTDLAIAVGISKQQISLLRSGVNCFGDETARRVAELLNIDPAYVIACAYAQRASDPQIKKIWVKMARAFGALAMVAGVSGPPTPAESAALHNGLSIHYTNRRRRSDSVAA